MSDEKNSPVADLIELADSLDGMMETLNAITSRLRQDGYTPEQAREMVVYIITHQTDGNSGEAQRLKEENAMLRGLLELAGAVIEQQAETTETATPKRKFW